MSKASLKCSALIIPQHAYFELWYVQPPKKGFARKTELNKTVAATGIKYDLTSYF